jgi:hypothetical protein
MFSNLRAWLERGRKGHSILGLPDRSYCRKMRGHERPWVAAGELVGSSARAWKARGQAWERQGMVWECSPSNQLNQDGLMEEIDDSVRGSCTGGHGVGELEPGR